VCQLLCWFDSIKVSLHATAWVQPCRLSTTGVQVSSSVLSSFALSVVLSLLYCRSIKDHGCCAQMGIGGSLDHTQPPYSTGQFVPSIQTWPEDAVRSLAEQLRSDLPGPPRLKLPVSALL
jgi:hypothetical protein